MVRWVWCSATQRAWLLRLRSVGRAQRAPDVLPHLCSAAGLPRVRIPVVFDRATMSLSSSSSSSLGSLLSSSLLQASSQATRVTMFTAATATIAAAATKANRSMGNSIRDGAEPAYLPRCVPGKPKRESVVKPLRFTLPVRVC